MIASLLEMSGWRRKWPVFTHDEIQRHNHSNSIWIVTGTSVYDVTDILNVHPGGARAILRCGGGARDCSVDYMFHSTCAKRQWMYRKVGEIADHNVHNTLQSVRNVDRINKVESSSKVATKC